MFVFKHQEKISKWNKSDVLWIFLSISDKALQLRALPCPFAVPNYCDLGIIHITNTFIIVLSIITELLYLNNCSYKT